MNSPPSLPQREWPGWDRDQDLAQQYSKLLREEFRKRVDIPKLIADWDAVNVIPQRISPGDAESFLMAEQAAHIQDALAEILHDLWSEAWTIGIVSALEAAGDISHPDFGVIKGGKKYKCDRGHDHDSPGGAGFLIRYKAPGEKRKYLFHKRADANEWQTFGGGLHPGESPWHGARREVEEEAGKIPRHMKYRHQVVDSHGGWDYTMFVMDSPEMFHPPLNGATPGEIAAAGWFTKKEISKLPLHPPFAENWDTIRRSKDDTYINSAMSSKSWNQQYPWAKPAPLADDPWRDMKDKFLDAGVPSLMAGSMASFYLTWESAQGATGVIGMVQTLVSKIADIMLQRRDGKLTVQRAIHEIDAILDDEAHALRITQTETGKAVNNGAQSTYLNANDIEFVSWITASDDRVCPECAMNAASPPVPITRVFPSGNVLPPQHPNCRCVVVPAKMPARDQLPDVADWMALSPAQHKSAETPYLSSHHAPIGHEGLWHSKHPPLQLPAYIQNIRNALMRGGMDEREAHAMAVAAVERWARGDLRWGPHRHVTPEVIAASRRAVAEWEALRANHP